MLPRPTRSSLAVPLAVFAALVLGAAGAALAHFRGFARELRGQIDRELSSVADLKVAQLVDARRAVLEDLRDLATAPFFRAAVLDLAMGRRQAHVVAGVEAPLRSRVRRHRLQDAAVADRAGALLAATAPRPALDAEERDVAAAALAAGEPVARDRHGRPGELVIAIALRDAGGGGAAAVVARARLSDLIPASARSWPGARDTAEAFLAVAEDGDALVVDALRAVPGRPLPTRLRLDRRPPLPVALALAGHDGSGTTRDHRGAAVVSAWRRVPGSPWALVVKVDEAEVMAPSVARARALALAGVALVAAGALALTLWWRAQLRAARERARAEDDRLARERLAFLWTHSNDIVIVGDEAGHVVEANDRAVEAYGYAREELQRLTVNDLRAPSARADMSRERAELVARGGMRFETVHRRKDGTTFPVEVSSRLFEAGGRRFVYATGRDVSERHALERMAQLQGSLLARLNDAVVATDRERRVTAWTGAAERIYGRAAAEVVGRPLHEALGVEPEEAAALSPDEAGAARRERVHRRRDGAPIDVAVTAVALNDGDGRRVGQLLVSRDVTERKRAEAALRVNEERLRLALDVTEVGICDIDVRAGEGYFSPQLLPLYRAGGPRVTVERVFAGIHPDDAARVRAAYDALVSGAAERLETEHRLIHAGVTTWLRVYGRAVERAPDGRALRVIATVSDITRERRLQAQLVFADRLASIGTLAAGVAHEINNPLSYLLANFEFVEERLAASRARDEDALAAVREARDGARRIAEIVRGLRTFSRREREPRAAAVLDVREAVHAAARIAEGQVRPRARLVLDLGPAPLVAADEHEVAQVALNLILNAAHAIPEGRPADHEIRVSTAAAAGGRAVLEVRDTGSGIAPEHLPRIFDPFFTTKPVGEGSGLGLAICHGIVEGLGGSIEVESVVGRGTAFRVYLPPARADSDLALQLTTAAAESRRGRVLVLDDEALVCRAVARTLGREHEVIEMTDPAEAMARLARGERVDVVVCDLMMPGLTGMECYDELSRVRPELARTMVFLTGGAFTDAARAFLERVPNRRVEKPFDAGVLRRAVAEGLGSGGAAEA